MFKVVDAEKSRCKGGPATCGDVLNSGILSITLENELQFVLI